MADEKKEPEYMLSPKLNGKYKNVNHYPGEFHYKGINYDFRTMDEATAEKLFKAGCKYIEKIGGDQSSKTTPKLPGA